MYFYISSFPQQNIIFIFVNHHVCVFRGKNHRRCKQPIIYSLITPYQWLITNNQLSKLQKWLLLHCIICSEIHWIYWSCPLRQRARNAHIIPSSGITSKAWGVCESSDFLPTGLGVVPTCLIIPCFPIHPGCFLWWMFLLLVVIFLQLQKLLFYLYCSSIFISPSWP